VTEIQARERFAKLLAITLDRGAARGEQENATRAMGALLQAHPSLRDLISAAGTDTAQSGHTPPVPDPLPQEPIRAFWHGVLVGIGASIVTLAVLVLTSLMERGRDTT